MESAANSHKLLSPSFYLHPTIDIAQALLGNILIHTTNNSPVGGMIVETEAYLTNDPASHGFVGPNRRNAALFKKAGIAYIYHIYGIHYCLNVVTEPSGVGEAVLIRALEPKFGIGFMEKRRKTANRQLLSNGPGKLTQALGISPDLNEHDFQKPPLQIFVGEQIRPTDIVTTTRIGITKAADEPLRFYIKHNPYVSK